MTTLLELFEHYEENATSVYMDDNGLAFDELRPPLVEAIKATMADAERYRWLRDVDDATWRPFGIRAGCSAEQADAEIDAAITKLTAPE